MPPVTPPLDALDDEQREEARRQAEGSGLETAATAADLALGTAEILLTGAATMVADATGAVLGATMDAAKASFDVVGNVIGGLADL